MDKPEVKFTSEMKMLLKEANELSVKNNYSEISIYVMYLAILKKYINSSLESVECKSFWRLISEIPESKRTQLLEKAESLCTRSCRNLVFKLPEHYKTGELVFSPDLETVFRMALDAQRSASRALGKKIETIVGTLEVLIGLYSNFEKEMMFEVIEDSFDLGKMHLMAQVLVDGPDASRDPFSEKEEERRLNFDSAAGFDNNNSGGFEPTGGNTAMSSRKADPNSTTPILDQFATDMTKNAEDGLYDPVVGRDREIRELINILCCRKKNNAVLLGDPGCGKTAIVECLAQKLVSGDVPRDLKGFKIMSLSSTDLLAGTMYRGQAEERVQKLCKELKENRNIILYMDEFHQATSENQTSISDMLKPALGRGELTMIASTTIVEYKKYIEKDGALKRRFQKVLIEEPNLDDTIEILKNLAPKYEKFHHVRYTEEVLKSCAEWADKYIYDRKSPDKAIDLMDTAGSRTKLDNPVNTEVIEKAEAEISEMVKTKNDLVEKDNLEEAMEVRDRLKKKREELEKIKSSFDSDSSGWPLVTSECVAKVVSDLTNIPADKINNPEIAKLRGMKDNLLAKVIGQDESIKAVSLSLSKSFLGLRDESRPIASLMFVGPTGVGKTLLCEEICNTIYGDKKALLRIDCGEYAAEHTVTKLIGAPASYVGYGEPGLFDSIRERPNSLVLFDEIEKMHPSIINTIFLNIMSTGMVKMSNGVDVSFRNCIVVFTGNVGTKELELHGNGIGFTSKVGSERKKETEEIVMKSIKKQFRPEFINRLSGIVVFNELGKEEMDKIFYLELAKLQTRLGKKGLTLSVTDKLKDYIVEQTDTKYGARDLSRGIAKYVEDKICEYMLENDITGKTIIQADINSDSESVIEFKA